MKILQTAQKYYEMLGINATNRLAFSRRELFGFLVFGYNIVSQLVYICSVASGFAEYVDCVSSICCGIIMLICFAATVFRKTTIFDSIGNIERIIHISETRSLGLFYF